MSLAWTSSDCVDVRDDPPGVALQMLFPVDKMIPVRSFLFCTGCLAGSTTLDGCKGLDGAPDLLPHLGPGAGDDGLHGLAVPLLPIPVQPGIVYLVWAWQCSLLGKFSWEKPVLEASLVENRPVGACRVTVWSQSVEDIDSSTCSCSGSRAPSQHCPAKPP